MQGSGGVAASPSRGPLRRRAGQGRLRRRRVLRRRRGRARGAGRQVSSAGAVNILYGSAAAWAAARCSCSTTPSRRPLRSLLATATTTATASSTWPSAPPARTSARWSTRARSPCSSAGRRHHHGRHQTFWSGQRGGRLRRDGRQLRALAGPRPAGRRQPRRPGRRRARRGRGHGADAGAVNLLAARPAGWSTAPWPPRATRRAATRSGSPWPPATSTHRRRRRRRRRPRRDGQRPAGRRRGQRVQRPADRARQRAAAVPGVVRHPGRAETGDGFGEAVAPTDSNGIGQWDLAVGVPGEDIGPDEDAGIVNLLAGSTTGPERGHPGDRRPTPRTSTASARRSPAGSSSTTSTPTASSTWPSAPRREGGHPAVGRRGDGVLGLGRRGPQPRRDLDAGQPRPGRHRRGVRLLRVRAGVARPGRG